MEDSKGETTEPYTFKLTNTCNVGVNYNIDLEIIQEDNAMSAKNIATKIDENDKVVLLESTKTAVEGEEGDIYKIGSGTLDPHTSVEHSLRLWLDINAGNDAQNKTFKSKIIIDALQNQVAIYTEQILNGADPVISEDLVPVKIDKATGKVTKAKETEEWYNYKNKEWANAVILKEGIEIPADNAEIKEDSIESYFVWIPKYSYKLFDMGDYQSASSTITDIGSKTAIEIEFGLVNTTNDESNKNHKECATPMKSGASGECNVGEWMTHPAFLAFDTKGLWVGKFETSDAGGNKVQIKPNKGAWRNITVKSIFDTSYNYQRNLESHMMKNTEWGAVAYLTQSIYGRCTSSTECTEVALNGNTSYTTGYTSTNIPYTTKTSVASSTTNNYTGIYDMNGGSWEYMASVMYTSDNQIIEFGSSGMTANDIPFKTSDGMDYSKYYDIYKYGADMTNWGRRILGDATGEMGPFKASSSNYIGSYFNDWAIFVYHGNSWFVRGGCYGDASASGIFAFARYPGDVRPHGGFRIVLTPTNEVA